MSRVKVTTNLNNLTIGREDKNIFNAILNDRVVRYKEENTVVEIHFNISSIQMIRKVEKEAEYNFIFQLKNPQCECRLLKYNQIFKLNIKVENMDISENYFEVIYQIENNDRFHFKCVINKELS